MANEEKIIRFKKTPLVIGSLVACIVILFMWFSAYNRHFEKVQMENISNIAIPDKDKNKPWYMDEKYDEIHVEKFEPTSTPPKNISEVEVPDEKIEEVSSFEPVIKELNNFLPNNSNNEELAKKLEEKDRALKSPASLGLSSKRDNKTIKAKSVSQINLNNNLDEYVSEYRKQRAISKYEVKAGSIIPAAMIGGLNSDLPGQAMAQVKENIYDSLTGNHVLIPQGAKIIGEYSSEISYGQRRVFINWNRLMFPDGSSFNLDKMIGSDVSGYSGFEDEVDNHYLKTFGSAILMSLISTGADSLSDNQAPNDTSVSKQIAAVNATLEMSKVTNKLLQKNLDVSPTLKIKPGFKFSIIVSKDLILPKIGS